MPPPPSGRPPRRDLRSGDRVATTRSLQWGKVPRGATGRITSVNIFGEHTVELPGGRRVRARAEELARLGEATPWGPTAGTSWWDSPPSRERDRRKGPPGGRRQGAPRPAAPAPRPSRFAQPSAPSPAAGPLLRFALAIPLVVVIVWALAQLT